MKNMKGITLIALVITIVVLIILAGVVISLSLGENGIFNKAKFATEEYANEQEKEEATLADYENKIDSYIGNARETTQIGISGYSNLLKATEKSIKIAEYNLDKFSLTQGNNFNQYFKYEEGNITCIQSGWYELVMEVAAYSSGTTGSFVQTYLNIDSVSYLFTRSVSVNANARGYADMNSKTIFLKEGTKISIKKSITAYNFSTSCECNFYINKI